jgi:hypothetical protein
LALGEGGGPNTVGMMSALGQKQTFAMQTVRFTLNSGHGSCAAG